MKNFASLVSALALLALSLAPLNAVANMTDHPYQHGSHAAHHASNSVDSDRECATDDCNDTAAMCCAVGVHHCTGAAIAFKAPVLVPYQSQVIQYTELNDTALGTGSGLEPPPPRI